MNKILKKPLGREKLKKLSESGEVSSVSVVISLWWKDLKFWQMQKWMILTFKIFVLYM